MHFTFRKTNGNWLMHFIKLDKFFLFLFSFLFGLTFYRMSLALFISFFTLAFFLESEANSKWF